MTSNQLALLLTLSLGITRAVLAEHQSADSDWGSSITNAFSFDDQTRWKAQLQLYATKDKGVVPILIRSLDIEGQRTEEKLAAAEQAGTRIRNIRLQTGRVLAYLRDLGGKDVIPDLICFQKEHPRFSWEVDQTIFELEHDTSKPVNTDSLQLSVHVEPNRGSPLESSHGQLDTSSTNVFPAGGHMTVSYAISSTQTNIPAFCAYAYEIFVDNRKVYSNGQSHVWSGRLEGRLRQVSLIGLSNGVHTVTLRIVDTDKSSSAMIRVGSK